MLVKPKKIRQVYLDHAATTYIDKKVYSAMQPFFISEFGNPSALYNLGRKSNGVLNDARRSVANLLGALPDNIIFTGSGTESDNLAIYGIAKAHEKQGSPREISQSDNFSNRKIISRGKHIISLAIEHHAVLHPLEDLSKQGWDITYIKVDKNGKVNVNDVIEAIKADTVLITIMYANNEIGTIEPIAELGRAILKYRKQNKTIYPFFHTDACQASGYLDLNVEKLHVDLMTINGSKMYGPKGVGILYLRRGVNIKPLILGGSQERRLRAGTENVAGIVGFAKALELAQKSKDKESRRIAKLRNYLWQRVKKEIPEVQLNGPELNEVDRLPNNLNVTFKNIEGEAMLLYLDEYGVMCSTGSACTSDSLDPSHVLTAIGLPYEMAHGSLRFSFGKCNTKADVDYLMKYLPRIIEILREMSPVNMNERKHAKYK